MQSESKSLRLVSSAIVFLVAFLFMFVIVATSVHAQGGSDDNTTTETTTSTDQTTEQENETENSTDSTKTEDDYQSILKQKREEFKAEREKKMEDRLKMIEDKKEQGQLKLAANRLEVCKKHEANINERMGKVAEIRTKQLEVFNKISDRTEAFYTDKGLKLDNYDTLVSDVNAKKAAAQAAIDALKQTDVDFKCDSEDPLGVAEAFKTARADVVSTMKDYKTSIKNLIVGVKSVASTTTDGGGQ